MCTAYRQAKKKPLWAKQCTDSVQIVYTVLRAQVYAEGFKPPSGGM